MGPHLWNSWLVVWLLTLDRHALAENETFTSAISSEADALSEEATPLGETTTAVLPSSASLSALLTLILLTTTGEAYTEPPTTAMTRRATTPLAFHLLPRPPPAPHHHQGPRWGPYFEDGADPHNVTARVGSTVQLDCKIGMLHDKTVTWVHRKQNSIHLLTVGRQAYSTDQRITLSFRYPSNWRLEILYVSRRDEGLYECQVSTHPTRVKQILLKVTAPQVLIMDENNHEVQDRYYKAGSSVELSCLATQVEEPGDAVTWRHGDTLITMGVSLNASLGAGSVATTLTIAHALRKHSGNYTCAVGSLASATVAVHILNGELPAAVHHGNLSGATPRPGGLCLLLMLLVHSTTCR